MTTFRFDTCDCVVTYSDDARNSLTRYDRKCTFHQRMDDATAFEEIKSAHLTKALTIKATRKALYGDERNPEKYGLGPDAVVAFEQTARNQRTVIIDEASVPVEKRAALTVELAKIATEHPVEVKPVPVRATPSAEIGKAVRG